MVEDDEWELFDSSISNLFDSSISNLSWRIIVSSPDGFTFCILYVHACVEKEVTGVGDVGVVGQWMCACMWAWILLPIGKTLGVLARTHTQQYCFSRQSMLVCRHHRCAVKPTPSKYWHEHILSHTQVRIAEEQQHTALSFSSFQRTRVRMPWQGGEAQNKNFWGKIRTENLFTIFGVHHTHAHTHTYTHTHTHTVSNTHRHTYLTTDICADHTDSPSSTEFLLTYTITTGAYCDFFHTQYRDVVIKGDCAPAGGGVVIWAAVGRRQFALCFVTLFRKLNMNVVSKSLCLSHSYPAALQISLGGVFVVV